MMSRAERDLCSQLFSVARR